VHALVQPLDQAGAEDNLRPGWGNIKFGEEKWLRHFKINYTSRLIGAGGISAVSFINNAIWDVIWKRLSGWIKRQVENIAKPFLLKPLKSGKTQMNFKHKSHF
jgi:hypothetical protein